MALKYRYSNASYTAQSASARLTTPSLCYRKDDITYYVPLLLNGETTTVHGWKLSVTHPAIACRYNDETYYAATSREWVPDIPAGTYTPSTFENMIRAFIADNGFRVTDNSFTVTVNNQTITISAGTTIKFRTSAAGSGTTSSLRAVMFGADVGNTVPATAANSSSGFTNLKSYVTYATNYGGVCTWSTYQDFSITVGGNGIKFA